MLLKYDRKLLIKTIILEKDILEITYYVDGTSFLGVLLY